MTQMDKDQLMDIQFSINFCKVTFNFPIPFIFAAVPALSIYELVQVLVVTIMYNCGWLKPFKSKQNIDIKHWYG